MVRDLGQGRTLACLLITVTIVRAADYPAPAEGDYTIRDFKFTNGEMLPELRIHYRTLGKAEKDAQGKTTNAVLIMHDGQNERRGWLTERFNGNR